MGAFLREFGITVSVAVMVSLFVALTLTPMLAARMPPPKQRAPGFSQVEFLVDAQEQRHPDLFFELAHMDTDGRLRQMNARRRLSEGASFGDGFEGP